MLIVRLLWVINEQEESESNNGYWLRLEFN